MNDRSLAVRLSEGLNPGGPLKPAAVERGLAVIENLTREFDLTHKRLRVVATAALRKTSDPRPFVSLAEEILKTKVEIISGEEEAALTCRGAVIDIPGDGPFIMLDIGGQSTEIGWQNSVGEWLTKSLPFGVVDLTERFVTEDPPPREEITAMGQAIRRMLEAEIPQSVDGTVLGVAGTATTLGMMSLGITEWRREAVHGLAMTEAELLLWKRRIVEVTAKERIERFGVRPVRADVFPAGICILEEVLAYFGKDAFTISVNGLRVGAALSLVDFAL